MIFDPWLLELRCYTIVCIKHKEKTYINKLKFARSLKDLVAHQSVQYLLNDIWYGGMKQETSITHITFASAFPPLIPCIIQFDSSSSLGLLLLFMYG